MTELHLEPLPGNDWPSHHAPTPLVISGFPCVLGRSSRCDERIDDLRVSRRHCTFSVRDGRVWVEDLNSQNGSRLNGERFTGARPLAEGDVLQVGYLAFHVRMENVPAPSVVSALPGTIPAGINREPARGPVDCEAAANCQPSFLS
jgi:predicted component of type VI protein secretion system